MKNRLLTDLEICEAKTLKAVGKWLENNTTTWQEFGLDGSTFTVFTLSPEYVNQFIQGLLRGEMPK